MLRHLSKLTRRHAQWVVIPMLAWAIAAHAQNESAPKAPPEIKKTVDAFVGHWILAATDQEPGSQKPVRFRVTIDCKRASLGAAVRCVIAGRIPGAGKVEAAAVIGYSPDEQRVRWMEISSTGEYHDHKGQWNGDTIEFEPLPYTVSGAAATEYLSIRFPSPSHQMLRSVTETAAGKSIVEWGGPRTSK